MTDILKIAYQHLAESLKEVKAWQKVVIDNGGKLPAVGAVMKPVLVKKSGTPKKVPAKQGGPGKKAQVYALAAECIGQHNGHAPRNVIHEYLANKGINLTPKRLTAYLSESPDFETDPKKGWSVQQKAAA